MERKKIITVCGSLNFKEEISQEAKNIQDTQKESEKKNV